MRRKALRTAAAGAALVFLAGATACSSSGAEGGDGGTGEGATVAYLTPSATITRWASQDVPNFETSIEEYLPGSRVLSFEAQGEVQTQLQQAKSAISQGAEVLLLGAVSADQSGGLVDYAKQNDVPVIAMTLNVNDAPIDAMIGDDAVKLGEDLAQYMIDNTSDGDTIATVWGDATFTFAQEQRDGALKVLQPYIDNGTRTVVGDQFAQGWTPDSAQKLMDAILLQNSDIDAVLSANDDMARGVRAALDKAGVGEIPISGIDATLSGVQAILQGKQSMTLYRSFATQADIAARTVAALLSGSELPEEFTDSFNNGAVDVPFASVPSTTITIENIQVLIDEGVFTRDEVCKGMPAGAGPC